MKLRVRPAVVMALAGALLGATTGGRTAWGQSPEPTTSQPASFEPESPSSAATQGSVAPSMTPRAKLQQAVRYYQMGERVEARRVLATLVVSESVPPRVRQEARIYLAELLLVEGEVAESRGFLRQVLAEDPDFAIDRFRHSPEVVGEFDYVKAQMVEVRPPEPEPEPEPVVLTTPLSAWSPFGRYHFTHGRPGRGLFYLSSVTASAVVSGVSFGVLYSDRSEVPAFYSRRWVQWSSTTLFWGMWTASTIDAHVHFRKSGAQAVVSPAVGLAPGPSGLRPTVAIRGRF